MRRGGVRQAVRMKKLPRGKLKKIRKRKVLVGKFSACGYATTYFERDQIVESLGFSSYRDYLQSDIWDSIRTQVLSNFKHQCQICKERWANEVHHIHYTKGNLSGRHLNHLVSLCDKCHHSIEFDGLTKRDLVTQAIVTKARLRKAARKKKLKR